MADKIVSVDVKLLRKKLKDKTLSAVESITERVSETAGSVGAHLSEKKNKALGSVLERSIEVLEKAQKKLK